MHHPTLSFVTLALTAATASATSSILFKNFCNEGLYISINNNQPPYNVSSGAAFSSNIEGQGNTAILTKVEDTFGGETAKAVLGTSTDEGVLYWSLSNQDGDPFVEFDERFNITSGGKDATGVVIPNICGNTTTYDGQVHACQDSGAVVLNYFACPFNAAA